MSALSLDAAVFYPAFTVAMVLASGLCAAHAWGDRQLSTFYVASLAYGLVLEKLVILAFQAYTYPHEQMLSVLGVPIAIGLGWSAVIYGGRATAESLGLSPQFWPSFAALYGLHVDLAMDAVAVRVPYWEWSGGGAWFGVPISNFVGWFLVAFLFVAVFRALAERTTNPAVLGGGAVVASVALLVVALEAYTRAVGESLGLRVGVIVGLMALAGFHLGRADFDPRPAAATVAASAFVFHGYFLAVLVALGAAVETPALLVVSLAMAGVGLAVHVLPSVVGAGPSGRAAHRAD